MACSKNAFHTSNPSSEYSFSWEIDDFHLTSLNVSGPRFKPMPGIESEFILHAIFEESFLNARNYFYLALYSAKTLTDKDAFKIQTDITLCNRLGKRICSSNKLISCTESPTYLLSYCCYAKTLSQVGLADGKLILSGTLTFSNYQVSTTPISVGFSWNSSSSADSRDIIKELPETVKTIYESGLSSEVITFSVNEKELTAHKSVLCCHSTVFERMFEHDMEENITNKVKIDDADFDTFKDFLGYLYTGVLKEDKYEHMLSLYSVAMKYQVRNLQEACVSFLTNKMAAEFLCDALVLADLHGDKELKEAVKIFVRGNFLDLVGTSIWIELVTTHPIMTLEILDFIKGK